MRPQNAERRLRRELLHGDPFVERVFGVEQQCERALAVQANLNLCDIAHFGLVGDCGNGPISASMMVRQTAVSSGKIAPDHRLGRKGLMGVSASIRAWNGRIGPRAERLYAVEPAGVATRIPSQASSGKATRPLTAISILAVCRVSRSSDTSLIAECVKHSPLTVVARISKGATWIGFAFSVDLRDCRSAIRS